MTNLRTPWLVTLFALLVLAAGLLVVLQANEGQGPDGTSEAGSPALPREGDDVMGAGPVLAARTEPGKTAGGPTEGPASEPDDWVIELAEVLDQDGKPVPEADVFLDRGEGYFDRTYSWAGKPLRIVLRRLVEGRVVSPAREDLPVYEDDAPVYVSVFSEHHARWNAAALRCPDTFRSTLKARLDPPRRLSGVVRNRQGSGTVVAGAAVRLTAQGVPAKIYVEEVETDADGRFVFDAELGIPCGALRVEVRPDNLVEDGLGLTVDVGPGKRELEITLPRTHSFQFLVGFAEPDDLAAFGVRKAAFHPERVPHPDAAAIARYYEVRAKPQPSRGGIYEALLPEGPAVRWAAHVSGYRPAHLVLEPSGRNTKHEVVVRFEPDPNSALLRLDVHLPKHRNTATLSLSAGPPEVLGADADAEAAWRVPREVRLAASVRLPSGPRLRVRVEPGLGSLGHGPWIIPPFDVTLRAGQTESRTLRALRGGILWVTRPLSGGGLSGLRVRLSQGGLVIERDGWAMVRNPKRSQVFGLHAELEPGRWTIELVRAGHLLAWSQSVDVKPGAWQWLALPDLERLK